MKIIFKKVSPSFRNFDYIMFQFLNGDEHCVSATKVTDYDDEMVESVIEVDGSEAEGGTVKIKGMPIKEAQLVDNDGKEFVVTGDKVFDYINRDSLCFYDEKADYNGYDYLPELINSVKGKLQDYNSDEFGSFYYWGKIDLCSIGLAYTTVDNEDLGFSDVPVQVSLDLKSYKITKYLDDYEVSSEQYSPEELLYAVEGICFDELIRVFDPEWEKYSEYIANAENEVPDDDGWDAFVVANAYGSDEDYGSDFGDEY